jgi:hypothetical protein
MTTQTPERICYEGIELDLLDEPELPIGHPRLIKLDRDAVVEQFWIFESSACWRSYIGSWAVRQGVLYLAGVEGIYKLLPGPDIPATWFSGTLRMPTGGVVSNVDGLYLPKYSSEFFANVERGVIVKTWNEFNEPTDAEK